MADAAPTPVLLRDLGEALVGLGDITGAQAANTRATELVQKSLG
jgi:hypothetical protein